MRGRFSTRIFAAVAVVVAAAGWTAPSVASAAPRLVAPRPGPRAATKAVSLWCLSSSDCTAAGGYSSVKRGTLTLIWNWNGKSLSLQNAQNP
jgi:hypothetical protein